MSKEPNFNELMELINGGTDGRANCSVGLFVGEAAPDDSVNEKDNFIVKKPIVNISPFVEENKLYYSVEFLFKSYDDTDYKQMWKFLCRHVEDVKRARQVLESGRKLESFPVLSISVIPDEYNGKYFAFINMPYDETLTRTEDAYEKAASISIFCEAEDFSLLVSDDDIVDKRGIEREVESEIDAILEMEEDQHSYT